MPTYEVCIQTSYGELIVECCATDKHDAEDEAHQMVYDDIPRAKCGWVNKVSD